ncbi:hypothetical protein [Winogradskyella sediminis]|uniref:hypothetical protein n=1 Tax=Winogradskyella sediminis TaxID=1382466 RepID=UPI003AA863F1
METSRKHKREWVVYDQQMNQFYNMNCTSILEEQHLQETPSSGFSYDEAERFIVHCDNKKYCKIVNIKQPKYLLNFELMVYRKEQAVMEAKENSRYINNAQNIQSESHTIRESKNDYFTALGAHKAESLKPMDGVMAKALDKRKPRMEDYNLTSNDFDAKEKSKLLSYYGISI